MKLLDIYNEIIKEQKCWQIKEERPIKVKITETLNKQYYSVLVPEMKMRYETFNHLSPVTGKIVGGEYNMKNGNTSFFAYTKEDLNEWLEKYNKIITI